MRVLLPDGSLDPRIEQDPRLSQSQVQAIRKAADVDDRATLVGLDARMRPVLRATLGGPGRTEYALLRNGDPAKPARPLAETWRANRTTNNRRTTR
jgi:hypothetical protein